VGLPNCRQGQHLPSFEFKSFHMPFPFPELAGV
jgi:hypothetical protein